MVLSGAAYRWGLGKVFRAMYSGRISAESSLSTRLSANTGVDSEPLRPDMVKPLVAQITYPIVRLSGDGAYDQVKVYDELETRRIEPVIPPRSNAVMWTNESGNNLIHARNELLTKIDCVGLAEWKCQIGYHRPSKAETGMFRWKTIFGERLSTRLLANQQAEVRLKANCLNRFTKLGMPKAVKRVLT